MVLKDDDAALHPDDAESLWDSALRLSHVMPGGKFPASTSFRLRKPEAMSLKFRYALLRPGNQDNLITVMVNGFLSHKRVINQGIDHVWKFRD
jgi:hypothetical protein